MRAAINRSDVTCSSVNCTEDTLYLSNLVSWEPLDPCRNFYAFVCRRWTSRFASDFVDSVTTDDDYGGFLENKIRLSPQNKAEDSRILRPLRDIYDRCNDLSAIDDSGWELLLN